MIKLELTPGEAMTLAIALGIAKQAETNDQERAEFEKLLTRVQALRTTEHNELMEQLKEAQNED